MSEDLLLLLRKYTDHQKTYTDLLQTYYRPTTDLLQSTRAATCPPKIKKTTRKTKKAEEDSTARSRSASPSPIPPNLPPLLREAEEMAQGRPRKVRMFTNLSEEQELDMKEWLLANPWLYTKGMKQFKDTVKKTHMWEDKAK